MRLGILALAIGKLCVLFMAFFYGQETIAQQTYDLQLANKTFPGNGTMTVDVQIRRTSGSSNFTLGKIFDGVSTIRITHNNDGTSAGQMDASSVALHSNVSNYFVGSNLSVAGQVDAMTLRGAGSFTVTGSFQSIFVITYTLGKSTTSADLVTMGFSTGSTDIRDGSNTSQTQGTFTGFSNEVLPVELTEFEAKWLDGNPMSMELPQNVRVALSWQTAMEENNSHFEIQRLLGSPNVDAERTSPSGKQGHGVAERSWQTIGRVEGVGNSYSPIGYHYIDNLKTSNSKPETIYYRLKQVDYNGNFEYSPVRTLNFKPEIRNPIFIYPNPAANVVNINSNQPIERVEILNLRGQVVRSFVKETHELDIGSLTSGTYLIRMLVSDHVHQQKLRVN